jgi:hypothetical protein
LTRNECRQFVTRSRTFDPRPIDLGFPQRVRSQRRRLVAAKPISPSSIAWVSPISQDPTSKLSLVAGQATEPDRYTKHAKNTTRDVVTNLLFWPKDRFRHQALRRRSYGLCCNICFVVGNKSASFA